MKKLLAVLLLFLALLVFKGLISSKPVYAQRYCASGGSFNARVYHCINFSCQFDYKYRVLYSCQPGGESGGKCTSDCLHETRDENYCYSWSTPVSPGSFCTGNGSEHGGGLTSFCVNCWVNGPDDPGPGSSDKAPIGWHDGDEGVSATCLMRGWACDPDSWSTKLNVHFWEDSNFVGGTTANLYPDDLPVAAECGETAGHRFEYNIPQSRIDIWDGDPHTITAYALGVNGSGVENGNNPPLSGTPKTITCPLPDTTPPTCTIFGPGSVNINTDVTYTATGDDEPENNLEKVKIYKSPTENRSWTEIGDCPGPSCEGTTQFSSVGTYYVTCSALDVPGNKCSGNPWCNNFDPVIDDEVDCEGWKDCTTSDLLTVTVTKPGPWWQVKDADVITNENLISPIPGTCVLPACNPYFDLKGPGGYPGVPAYGSTTAIPPSFGEGSVSEDPFRWLANSKTPLNKVYDYSYFQALIRPNVEINEIEGSEITGGYLKSGGVDPRGYVWFRRQGDLIITGTVNLQDNKVVLLVDGDLYLGRPPEESATSIRLDDGSGFFMAIVSGDIIISPKVSIDPLNPQPILEGIFLAERQVKTGTYGEGLDGQLYIRGSVAAYGGMVLERNLTDNSERPAELFEYGPDLLFTFPRDLTFRKYKWKEIAP